jgi:hypothetical protein
VAYFNHKYVLIGYDEGKVEIRDTETLSKVFGAFDFKSKILEM